MGDAQLFKWLAIISPIVSGIIAGILTHILTNRSKRLEYLYQHKIPAFKEIQKILILYKTHLDKTIVDGYSSDFSPYENDIESYSSLEAYDKLIQAVDINRIYLNKKSSKAVEKLFGEISLMCNVELLAAAQKLDDITNTSEPYLQMSNKVDKVIDILYKDLNLV